LGLVGAMKLLVSVVDAREALDALSGGCDIVDVKNPAEGALGAGHPSLIREVVEAVAGRAEVSATIGDLPNLPGTSALAALGAASLGIDYVKAGLYGVKEGSEALRLGRWIVRAVKEFRRGVRVILCGYGDAALIGSIDPRSLPVIAADAGADGILIDLKLKGDRDIFSYLADDDLAAIVEEAHRHGLTVAIAGGLSARHVGRLKRIGADIMGVRRGVCDRPGWGEGRVSRDKVRKLYMLVKGGR